eukprot:m.24605 g.24605  ORF g.24605 m.24605 type:complete len:127 (+) comp36399_c0_seq1:73-453(+)
MIQVPLYLVVCNRQVALFFVLLQFILIMQHISSPIAHSWAVLLTPTHLYCGLVALCIYTRFNPAESKERAAQMFFILLFALSEVLVAVRLEGTLDTTWSITLIPLFVFLSCFAIVYALFLFKLVQH